MKIETNKIYLGNSYDLIKDVQDKSILTSFMGVPERKIYKHPTMKPTPMIEKMIEISSKENDVILDTFSGSGTIPYCARKLNRQYIGFEIDQEFYDMSIKRMNKNEQLTLDI